MKIKNIILDIKSRLTWAVENEISSGRNMEITSDPWSRTHIIHIPTQGTDIREIEYLHELAHAVLAERHILLSTAYFLRGTPEEKISKLVSPIRVASDWFADDLLLQWVPDEERAEIQEHIGYAREITTPDKEIMYGGGLFFAQGVHYCGNKKHDIPRRYRKPADILLAVDPGHPSVSAKQKLVNNLAELTSKLKIALTSEQGAEVWEVK